MPVPEKIRTAVDAAFPVDKNLELLKQKTLYDRYEALLSATNPFTCRIESHNTYYNKEYVITSGSGFVFHPDGYIATNSLVVGNLPYCRVIMNNGMSYKGDVVWLHEPLGLAIVRIEEKNLPAIPLSCSRDGQVVAIAGIPDREHLPIDPVTKQKPFFPLSSYISELDWMDRMSQNEGPAILGHIGGPIVNRYAESVAVADLDEESRNPVGIPVEYLKYYLLRKPDKCIVKTPRVSGLLLFELSISFRMDFDLPTKHFGKEKRGVVVVQCVEGSPAYEAGLRVNDLILEVNDQRARTQTVTFHLANTLDVFLKVHRKGEDLVVIHMPYNKWPVNEDDSWM